MNFYYDKNATDKENINSIMAQAKRMGLKVNQKWAAEILKDLRELDNTAN